MVWRCLPVEARLRLVGVGWLRVVRRHIRDHVVQVDGLVHLEVSVANHIGELNGAKNHAHRVALALETQHATHGAAGGEDHLAFLKIADLRRIRVEGPRHAIGGDRLDGFIAVFHEDDVRLVLDGGIAARSDSKLKLRLREGVRIYRMNDSCFGMELGIEDVLTDAKARAGG